ncbi:MAG: flagellar hook-basal body protein [Spirochaetaceae bacterium]|nr:flagellar hook-basal body protein [Spirochaetaceae bacterium]
MLRGLYTGAAGMVAQMHRMDAIANNVANVDLNGFKRDTSIHKSFPELLIRRLSDNGVYVFPMGSADTAPIVGKLGLGVEQNEVFTSFSQGALKVTESSFDFALDGKGFFVVETPRGERFTRNGNFIIGREGMLLTNQGFPVLGENGRIFIKENNFIVDQLGRIFVNQIFQDDPERLVSMRENQWEETIQIDTLRIVDFEQERYLRKQGGSMWIDTEESGPAVQIAEERFPRVLQGFLEASNVNVVQEMVKMIEVNRAYEANQKAVTNHDNITAKLINEGVRV